VGAADRAGLAADRVAAAVVPLVVVDRAVAVVDRAVAVVVPAAEVAAGARRDRPCLHTRNRSNARFLLATIGETAAGSQHRLASGINRVEYNHDYACW
jgi:hypothetical protein